MHWASYGVWCGVVWCGVVWCGVLGRECSEYGRGVDGLPSRHVKPGASGECSGKSSAPAAVGARLPGMPALPV